MDKSVNYLVVDGTHQIDVTSYIQYFGGVQAWYHKIKSQYSPNDYGKAFLFKVHPDKTRELIYELNG